MLPLEKIIHKTSGAAAEQLGLADRGCLWAGCCAKRKGEAPWLIG